MSPGAECLGLDRLCWPRSLTPGEFAPHYLANAVRGIPRRTRRGDRATCSTACSRTSRAALSASAPKGTRHVPVRCRSPAPRRRRRRVGEPDHDLLTSPIKLLSLSHAAHPRDLRGQRSVAVATWCLASSRSSSAPAAAGKGPAAAHSAMGGVHRAGSWLRQRRAPGRSSLPQPDRSCRGAIRRRRRARRTPPGPVLCLRSR